MSDAETRPDRGSRFDHRHALGGCVAAASTPPQRVRKCPNQTKSALNCKYAAAGEGRSSRGMNNPNLLGLLSACTALIATIVGPLVALTVARRQFIATAISGNRHKWIEVLRN